MADSYNKELELWALPQLAHILPLDEQELKPILTYTESLSDSETESHLQGLLGDSAEANQFIAQFIERRNFLRAGARKQMSDEKSALGPGPNGTSSSNGATTSEKAPPVDPPAYAPPPGPPPANAATSSEKPPPAQTRTSNAPAYLPPSGAPPANAAGIAAARHHTNQVIEAGKVRARDEVYHLRL